MYGVCMYGVCPERSGHSFWATDLKFGTQHPCRLRKKWVFYFFEFRIFKGLLTPFYPKKRWKMAKKARKTTKRGILSSVQFSSYRSEILNIRHFNLFLGRFFSDFWYVVGNPSKKAPKDRTKGKVDQWRTIPRQKRKLKNFTTCENVKLKKQNIYEN